MSIATVRVNLIRRAVETVGETLPKPVARATADYDKLAEAAAALPVIPVSSSTTLSQIVCWTVVTRSTTRPSESSRRVMPSPARAGSIAYGVPIAGERRIIAALTKHADAILETLHRGADTAGAALAKHTRSSATTTSATPS